MKQFLIKSCSCIAFLSCACNAVILSQIPRLDKLISTSDVIAVVVVQALESSMDENGMTICKCDLKLLITGDVTKGDTQRIALFAGWKTPTDTPLLVFLEKSNKYADVLDDRHVNLASPSAKGAVIRLAFDLDYTKIQGGKVEDKLLWMLQDAKEYYRTEYERHMSFLDASIKSLAP